MDSNVLVAVIAGSVAIGGTFMTAVIALAGSWFITRGDRQRLGVLEARTDSLWAAREADALIKRAQGDHIDTLEDHIRAGKPPPPPPRPTGV